MIDDIQEYKKEVFKDNLLINKDIIYSCEELFKVLNGDLDYNPDFESEFEFLNVCYFYLCATKMQNKDEIDLVKISVRVIDLLNKKYSQDLSQLFLANVMGIGILQFNNAKHFNKT
jgi:hypothetical protein